MKHAFSLFFILLLSLTASLYFTACKDKEKKDPIAISKIDESVYDEESHLLTDLRDDQVYRTVTISKQTWMAENLNHIDFSDSLNNFCYDNSTEKCISLGRLYSWESAMQYPYEECTPGVKCRIAYPHRGACPKGWHIPTKLEWEELFKNLSSPDSASLFLKSKEDWSSTGKGSDTYMFSILPAGYADISGEFFSLGDHAHFWVASEYNINLAYGLIFSEKKTAPDFDVFNKRNAFSIRCILDPPASMFCGDSTYDSTMQFCVAGYAYELCGGKTYDISTEFCFDGSIYNSCDGNKFNPKEDFCFESKIYALCGDSIFDPTQQFCFNDSTYTLCDQFSYNPITSFCSVSNMVLDYCGGLEYNDSLQFCHEDRILYLCGGESYDPGTSFCSDSTGHVLDFCGNKNYDEFKQFCFDETLYELCGTKPYDPTSQFCSDTTIVNLGI